MTRNLSETGNIWGIFQDGEYVAGDQSIIRIGHDIEITVIEVRGDQVRLGIAAPRDVFVHRMEVYDAIMEELRIEKEAEIEQKTG